MKLKYGVLLFAAAVAAVLVIKAPAAWLGYAVHSLTQGGVEFSRSWGTVWAGSAQVMVRRSSSEAITLPDTLAWTLGCSAWWRLACGIVLTTAASPQPIAINVNRNPQGDLSASVAAGQYRLPLNALNTLGAPFNTLKLSGNTTLSWQAFQIALDKQALSGKALPAIAGYIDIQQLRSSLTQDSVLGDYRVSASPMVSQLGGATASAQGRWQLAISTASPAAALQINGQGFVSQNGAIELELKSSAAPNSDAKLGALLNFLGRRQGNVYVLKLRQ